MSVPKRLRLKGHKLSTAWRGVGDNIAWGRCECGWGFRGWTERMRAVRRSHQSHLRRIAEGKPVPGFDIPNAAGKWVA